LNDRGEISHEELKTFVSSQTLRYLLDKGILQVSTYNIEGIKIRGLKQREFKSFGNTPCSGIYINLPLRERLKKLIQYAENIIAEGGDFLLIVPELELFEYYHKELYPIFGDRLVVFNSKLPEKEKLKNWFLTARDFPKIFLTTPKWSFAPLKKLSAVWLEEESSPSYKMEKRPYFNLKRLAFDLVKLTGAKLFISSEPPSLEIYLLKNRFEEKLEKNKPVKVFLYEALNPFREDTFLEVVRNYAGKEVLFLVPKKGYSNLYCPRCGHFEECPRCDVLLTLTEDGNAICNLCGYETELKNCTRCGEELQPFGYGVDRVKEIVERYIGNEEAKHFQYSTHPPAIGKYDAVFILFSDLLLSVPDFRKGEDLFQYLIKAKNRIKDNGFMFIHTRDSEHHAYTALAEDNTKVFYTSEVEYRKALKLPPFSRIYLVAINLSEEKEELAKKLFRELNTKLKPLGVEVSFSKAPIFRLREKYRYQVLVKMPLEMEKEIFRETVKVLKEIRNHYKFARIIPNPRSVV
jgi:primosomal protein N' (replication factor Y)